MTDKYMDRVAKLLATADSDSATPAERENAMDKAMRLSQAHAIDLALARAHQAKKERVEEPERREHKVGTPTSAEQKWRDPSKRNAHFVDLFLAIADAYDLRCVIGGRNTYVFATGMPSDHEMAERMFSLLAVQMVSEADAGLKRGDNKKWVTDVKRKRVPLAEEDRNWGGLDTKGQQYDLEPGVPADRADSWRYGYYDVENKEHPPPSFRMEDVYDANGGLVYETKQVSDVDARIWRVNFYQGFVSKIGSRLRHEKRQAMREAGIDLATDQSEKGLAIVDKKKAVEEAYEEFEKSVLNNGRSYQGASVSKADWSAQERGATAGAMATTGNERDLREG